MKRKNSVLLLAVLAAAAAVIAGSLRSQPWGLSNFRRWQVELSCRFLAARYAGERDVVEAALMEAGCPVIDTQAPYPAYLANSHGLMDFWTKAQTGENAVQKVYQVTEDGTVGCTVFRFENGKPYFSHYSTRWEERPILDWDMTENGNFYYQLYQQDKHYMTYDMIAARTPDRELWDLTMTYILPVGYQAVNLFLVDWQEGAWGSLSFNDLLEYFYYLEKGEKFDPTAYPLRGPASFEIPAPVFERSILPYLPISREELRRLSGYDPEQNCYIWRIYDFNDVMWFPHMEPSVTNCLENPDGTLTLTVEVASRDMKTDQFFTHQVTVRPMENGQFQYVGNRVTQASDYGLPFAASRLEMYGA